MEEKIKKNSIYGEFGSVDIFTDAIIIEMKNAYMNCKTEDEIRDLFNKLEVIEGSSRYFANHAISCVRNGLEIKFGVDQPVEDYCRIIAKSAYDTCSTISEIDELHHQLQKSTTPTAINDELRDEAKKRVLSQTPKIFDGDH